MSSTSSLARVTNEARSEVLAEFLSIKRDNFDTMASFLSRYTLLRKRVQDAKFELTDDFEVTFLFNAVKNCYAAEAKHWVASLYDGTMTVGGLLAKLSNLGNAESRNIQETNNSSSNKSTKKDDDKDEDKDKKVGCPNDDDHEHCLVEDPLQERDSLHQHDSYKDVPLPEADNQGDGSSPTKHPEAGVEQPLAQEPNIADVPQLHMSPEDLMLHYHRMPIVATNSQWLEVNAGSLDDGSDDASSAHPVLRQLKAIRRQRVRTSALPTPSDLYITDFASTGLGDLDSTSQTLDPTKWTQPE